MYPKSIIFNSNERMMYFTFVKTSGDIIYHYQFTTRITPSNDPSVLATLGSPDYPSYPFETFDIPNGVTGGSWTELSWTSF